MTLAPEKVSGCEVSTTSDGRMVILLVRRLRAMERPYVVHVANCCYCYQRHFLDVPFICRHANVGFRWMTQTLERLTSEAKRCKDALPPLGRSWVTWLAGRSLPRLGLLRRSVFAASAEASVYDKIFERDQRADTRLRCIDDAC